MINTSTPPKKVLTGDESYLDIYQDTDLNGVPSITGNNFAQPGSTYVITGATAGNGEVAPRSYGINFADTDGDGTFEPTATQNLYEYTPNEGFTGFDVVTYTLTNAEGDTIEVTQQVEVVQRNENIQYAGLFNDIYTNGVQDFTGASDTQNLLDENGQTIGGYFPGANNDFQVSNDTWSVSDSQLGNLAVDGTLTFTAADLLSQYTTVNGAELSIANVQLIDGNGNPTQTYVLEFDASTGTYTAQVNPEAFSNYTISFDIVDPTSSDVFPRQKIQLFEDGVSTGPNIFLDADLQILGSTEDSIQYGAVKFGTNAEGNFAPISQVDGVSPYDGNEISISESQILSLYGSNDGSALSIQDVSITDTNGNVVAVDFDPVSGTYSRSFDGTDAGYVDQFLVNYRIADANGEVTDLQQLYFGDIDGYNNSIVFDSAVVGDANITVENLVNGEFVTAPFEADTVIERGFDKGYAVEGYLPDAVSGGTYTITRSQLTDLFKDLDGDAVSLNSPFGITVNGFNQDNDDFTSTVVQFADGEESATFDLAQFEGFDTIRVFYGTKAGVDETSLGLDIKFANPLLTGNKAEFLDAGNQEVYTFAATDLLVGLDIFNDEVGQHRNFVLEDLTVTGGTLTYDAANFAYNFVAKPGFTGEVELSYTVSDQFGGSIDMTNSFTVVEGTNPNATGANGPIKNPDGSYPGEKFDPEDPRENFPYGDQHAVESVIPNAGTPTGVGDNYWTTNVFRNDSAWIDPDGGTVTKIEGSLSAQNAVIDDNPNPTAWLITANEGYTGYDQVKFTLVDDEGVEVTATQSRLYLQSGTQPGADRPEIPVFDATPTTVHPDGPVVEKGVEGVDFLYASNLAESRDNDRIVKRGEDAITGHYWVNSRDSSLTDNLVDGQEYAMIMGRRGELTADLTADEIIGGLESGDFVATKSFTSYGGLVMSSAFEDGAIDALVQSADPNQNNALTIGRIDASTGELLTGFGGALRNVNGLETWDNFAPERTLSGRNDNAYGDILAQQNEQTGGF